MIKDFELKNLSEIEKENLNKVLQNRNEFLKSLKLDYETKRHNVQTQISSNDLSIFMISNNSLVNKVALHITSSTMKNISKGYILSYLNFIKDIHNEDKNSAMFIDGYKEKETAEYFENYYKEKCKLIPFDERYQQTAISQINDMDKFCELNALEYTIFSISKLIKYSEKIQKKLTNIINEEKNIESKEL